MHEEAAAAPSRWSDKRSIAFALCLAASVAFAAILDLFAGGVIHLPPSSVAFLIAYSSLPTCVGLLLFRTPWTGRGLLAAAAVVGAIAFLPWHPRKRFVNDLHSIQVGMTVPDVDRVMGPYERRVDSEWSPSSPYSRYRGPGDRMVCFGSTVAGYDADICEVIYRDGRVVNVAFDPD